MIPWSRVLKRDPYAMARPIRWGSWITRVILSVLVAGATRSGCAGVLYVNGATTNVSGADGRSWTTAYAALGPALAAAIEGDEIWVAAYEYSVTSVSLNLRSGIGLYGGFVGTETEREQRDWRRNRSALRGAAPYVLRVAAGATNTTRIDGLVIFGATSAAIYCERSSPVIANNKICENMPLGRGIYCKNSFAIITNNYLYANGTLAQAGGAINAEGGAPQILNNRIMGNIAAGGAGISCTASSPVIAFNVIQGNTADMAGAGIECYQSSPEIHNNWLLWNRVNYDNIGGGGISCSQPGSPNIRNNVFVGNSVAILQNQGRGGAIYCNTQSSPSIVNNTILRCGLPSAGACLYSTSTNALLVANNVIAFNGAGIESAVAPVLRNNCVAENPNGNYLGIPDPTGTMGNLSLPPLLLEDSRYGRICLQPDSPCRDAGDSTLVGVGETDVYGQPRIQGGSIDIGAQETDGSTNLVETPIVRVSPEGNDDQDGSTWALAKRTVQLAIQQATETRGEVWVREGTYHENLFLRHNVYLYGGFRGDETTRAQRDFRTHETILDADQRGRVVSAAFLGAYAVIDGFTIRNGLANIGGGVLARASSIEIANNVITGNHAVFGSGVYCASEGTIPATPLIFNNRIQSNRAALQSVGFLNHLGGAGIGCVSANPRILNNLVMSNVVERGDSSRPAKGAGILLLSSPASVLNNTILGNQIEGASADDLGAGIYFQSTSTNPNGMMVNNLIAFNSSGLRVGKSLPPLTNNLLFGNTFFEVGLPAGALSPLGTNGNISVDPKLDPLGDGAHLGTGSPCIDAGDNTAVSGEALDLDGNPRISGRAVDIGAFEHVTGPSFSLRWAPKAAGVGWGLWLNGEADQRYVVEASPDLTSWTPLSTNVLQSATAEVIDPASDSLLGQRFYRAVWR